MRAAWPALAQAWFSGSLALWRVWETLWRKLCQAEGASILERKDSGLFQAGSRCRGRSGARPGDPGKNPPKSNQHEAGKGRRRGQVKAGLWTGVDCVEATSPGQGERD